MDFGNILHKSYAACGAAISKNQKWEDFRNENSPLCFLQRSCQNILKFRPSSNSIRDWQCYATSLEELIADWMIEMNKLVNSTVVSESLESPHMLKERMHILLASLITMKYQYSGMVAEANRIHGRFSNMELIDMLISTLPLTVGICDVATTVIQKYPEVYLSFLMWPTERHCADLDNRCEAFLKGKEMASKGCFEDWLSLLNTVTKDDSTSKDVEPSATTSTAGYDETD